MSCVMPIRAAPQPLLIPNQWPCRIDTAAQVDGAATTPGPADCDWPVPVRVHSFRDWHAQHRRICRIRALPRMSFPYSISGTRRELPASPAVDNQRYSRWSSTPTGIHTTGQAYHAKSVLPWSTCRRKNSWSEGERTQAWRRAPTASTNQPTSQATVISKH